MKRIRPIAIRALACASLILPATSLLGDATSSDAVQVFECAFGDDWDINYDGWPDRWTRHTGDQYPHYVRIKIRDDPSATSGRCLTIDLDGAAAAVSAPPVRVMSRFSYALSARLHAARLEHSSVQLTLDFYDAKGELRQTVASKSFQSTDGWVDVELPAVEPDNPEIDRVVIGLKTATYGKGDLKGQVSLSDVKLIRLPRIAVSTNNPSNVYTLRDGVVVRCDLSGIPERDPSIHFQLLDADGHELQTERLSLNGRLIVERPVAGEFRAGEGPAPAGFEGHVEWRPTVTEYGFYRVVVRMLSASPNAAVPAHEMANPRTIQFAVIPPLEMPTNGEFGWALPTENSPLGLAEVSRLVPHVGINWLKVPVWFDAAVPKEGDELIRFAEMVGTSNIEVVGVIDRPPATTELGARLPSGTPIAEVLALNSSAWVPSLEPVMTRLSLRVRWWQLGRDYDTSFIGLPNVDERIDNLRRTLFRFGQDVQLGISSTEDAIRPSAAQSSWDFQQYCAASPSDAVAGDIPHAPHGAGGSRPWVLIEPPAEHDFAEVRARQTELVRRMIAAKMSGAEAIFVASPFNDQNGLMLERGMPTELFLPWRTTAAMLGGAEYIGSMQLPSGSPNRIFARDDGRVIMVVWNDSRQTETLYLGKHVRQYDLLGIESQPAVQENAHSIEVGPTPKFIIGLDEAITRLRISLAFEHEQVPSIFAAPHANSLQFTNYFPQGIGGRLKLVVVGPDEAKTYASKHPRPLSYIADRWTIEPPSETFQLAPGATFHWPFEIRLKNALFGKQPVRIDFEIEADERYAFSVYRQLEVGTEDLTLEVNTRLQPDGMLVVEQLMTNSAPRLTDLKCYLWAKGHRPQRMQVYRLGRDVDRKLYRFPDGAELIGQELLLEIEEVNGPRVLKYRFLVDEPEPATAEAPAAEPAEQARRDLSSEARS